MKTKHYLLIITAFLMPMILLMTGCGNSGRESATTSSTFAASAACMTCHAGARNVYNAGVYIVDEWKASTHNTKNGASCNECHQANPTHPNPIAVTGDPDAAGTCRTCHTQAKIANHFTNYSGTNDSNVRVQLATWVTTDPNMVNSKCEACHNPHATSNTISANKAWADSGHGNPYGTGWTASGSFKTSQNCSRCHTTTNFVRYVTFNHYTSNFQPTTATWTLPAYDKSREVLGCLACHTDYSYALRPVGPVKVVYGTAAANFMRVQYGDAKKSNTCIACHAGRRSGPWVAAYPASATGSNATPHYLPAAGVLYKTIGFHNFSSGGVVRTYDFTASEHSKIGLTAPNTGTELGPCVACHMAYNSDEKHTFMPVKINIVGGKDTVEEIKSSVCTTCHSTTLTVTTLNTIKEESQAAFKAFKELLKSKTILLETVTGGVSSYSTGAQHTANVRNRGAYFNFYLMYQDRGFYAHSETYVKRLIYDSIDWANNQALDNDVSAAIDGLVTLGTLTADEATKAKAYLVPRP